MRRVLSNLPGVCLVTIFFVLTSGAAFAQQRPGGSGNSQGFTPVDQAVGDLDRLSTSMRVIQPGLNPYGDRTRLYRLQTPWSPFMPQGVDETYYRISPGVRARVDRLDYLIPVGKHTYNMNITPRKDGQFLELATPGMVYDLRPIPLVLPNAAGVDGSANPQPILQPSNAIDRRLNGQVQPQMIDGRVDGRIGQPQR